MASSHEVSGGVAAHARRWFKENRHAPLVRRALEAGERARGWLRLAARDGERPAIAGGRPVRLSPLPTARPYGRAERREIARVVREQNTSFEDGDAVRRLERELERRFGSPHAVAVSSGTAALHAALIAADIGLGDEVVVPALTHVSAALAVAWQGAVPRFADARLEDWNVDPSAVEAAITPRTRAIVVVHLCGVPCDLAALGAIARRHGLVLVEDAAHAHGSRFAGRAAGTIGDLGCLSFQSDKTLTTGEGGAVLTADPELARRVRAAITLGSLDGPARAEGEDATTERGDATTERGDATTERGDATTGGDSAAGRRRRLSCNYRLGALAAALGLGQLARLDAIRAARRENAARLGAALEALPGVRLQRADPRAEVTPAFLFVEIEECADVPSRDELARALDREHIEYRLPYPRPLVREPLFEDGSTAPVAERLCARGIGFRVDPALGPREIDATARAVRRILLWRGGR